MRVASSLMCYPMSCAPTTTKLTALPRSLDPSEFKSTAHAAMSQKAEPKPRGVGPRQQRKADRQLAQARAEAAAAESAKEKIKNTVNYESVNMATYKVNDSAVSRLSYRY